MKLRVDIQGLRAIAVGLVVAYHLAPERLTGGFVGVDVFFVISGFLITSHLLARPPRGMGDLAAFWVGGSAASCRLRSSSSASRSSGPAWSCPTPAGPRPPRR